MSVYSYDTQGIFPPIIRSASGGLGSFSYSYHPAIIDLYTEVDFGSITANATTVSNNGLVADLNATQVEYGRIIHVTDLESFGFSKTLNEASWKATSAWVGQGNLISFGRQTSPAVYGIITDGKVRLSGTADVDYSPAIDGRGILPLQGNSIIGIAAAITGSGSFRKFTGTSYSLTVNPDEKQMLFSFTGEVGEKNTEHYYGSGTFNNFSNVEEDKVFAWNGSGEIKIVSRKPKLIELSDEKHTENYNSSAVDYFTERDYGVLGGCTLEENVTGDVSGLSTGCIVRVDGTARVPSSYQVAQNNNAHTSSTDWGTITEPASLQQDWGLILTPSDLIPFGGIKVDPDFGCADKFLPSWTSRGYISKLSGVAGVPLDVGVRGSGGFKFFGASKTNFSLLQPGDGLFAFHSDSDIAAALGVVGEGRFSTFSGVADSISFNPEETQMLFSFTGEYKDLRFTFGTYYGDGRLFNVSGGEERGTNSYIGSGEINIFSRKPELIESSDEKHTEVYNESAFVPSVDYDYGLLLDPTQTPVTTLTTTTVTSDETAPTGVIRVGLNEIVSLGATYTVPNHIASPTSFIDNGLVSDIHSPVNDYGLILGTHAHGIPFGTVADITGVAKTPRVFNEVSEGILFKISGEAILPLFASVFGGGLFKPQGASKTNFSLLAPGDGHVNGMYGDGSYSFQVEHHGEGTFSTFSGGAESITVNPEEKQMLFSFTGGYSSLSFTHGTWYGSGRIKNLATLRAERTSYDYEGSGTILAWNKLEEARTYWYNCSSIVEFQDLDYGLLVDSTNISITDLTTQTISDATAPTGVVRIGQGEVVTLDGTYNVPSTTTIPTEFIDYNILLETEDQLLDHGHILDTVAMGQPACIYGEIDITGDAICAFQPSWTSRGGLRLDNAAKTNFSLLHIGSGDLFSFNGSSETLTVSIQGTGLFAVGGTSPYAAAIGVIGEGTLRKFSGVAESLTFNPTEEQMLFSFLGTAEPYNLTFSEFSSGSIKSLSGGYITETEAYYGSGTIKLRSRKPELTELSDEKHTEVYDLGVCIDPEELDYGLLVDRAAVACVDVSGDVTSNTVASTGCTSVSGVLSIADGVTYTIPSQLSTVTDSWDNGTVEDTEDGLWDRGWILDDTGKDCPFGELGVIRGDAVTAEIQVYTYVTTGESEHKVYGINISGDAEIVVPPQWDSPAEPPIDVTGDADPSLTRIAIFDGGSLFGLGGAAECTTIIPPTDQVLFKFVPGPFDRWTTYDWQPSWQGRGRVTLPAGFTDTRYVPHVIGSGTFRKFNGAAESLTVNPEERQLLFSFTGEHQVSFTANPPEDTARVEVGSLADTRFTPKYPGSGEIYLAGIADTRYVPHVIGSGFIPTFSGAAESITVNPEEKQMLFSFVGTREAEKVSVTETGFGTLHLTGESTQLLTFAEQPFGTIPVSGEAKTFYVPNVIGTGTLRKIGGSAESITFNPDEKQMLFSFIGEGKDSKSVVAGGSGTLFGFSGASVVTASAYETQGLYRVSGEVHIVFSLTHFGSGTFRKFGGSAESITVNPDERQLLFSFAGEGSESLGVAETKHIEVDISGKADPVLRTHAFQGFGTISVTGEAKTHYVPNVIGTGTFRKFSGAAESLTVNPEEKQMLFSFMGEKEERTLVREISKGGTLTFSGTSGDPLLTFAEQPFVQTKISGKVAFTVHRSIFGTGSLFGFGGAAESIAIVPEPSTILFQTSGESDLRVTRSYIGSGTLRKISGAAESITVNPDERQMLFSFTGEGADSRTAREIGTGTLTTTGEAGVLIRFAHTGEGTISLSGDAHTTRARDFVGFGNIPVLTGAAESISFNPDEKDLLFSFFGSRISEKSTFRELSQGGTLTVGSTSGDPLLTFAEQPYVEIDITGDSYDVRTRAYQGSGRISNVNNLDEAFAIAPYIGSGTTRITGRALIQVQLFQPPHVQVWII